MGDYYLDKIAGYLRENSRLSFSGHKRGTLRRRLESRLTELDLTCFADYWHYLSANADEAALIYDLVTTNETSFFRNPAQFSYLQERIIPRIALEPVAERRRLRILCAGCSTGEEPYSVAMSVLAALGAPALLEVEIIAGDLSRSCLKVAKAGFYPDDRLKSLPPGYLDRYFERREDGAVVSKKVQQLVRFMQLNLNDLMGPDAADARDRLGSFDIIFCRNVMIYFSPPCQQLLVETLHHLLCSGGYLFTGDAEPLHLFRHEFVAVEADCLIYQKTESV